MTYNYDYEELKPYYQDMVDALTANHGYSDNDALKAINDYYDVLELISGYYPPDEQAEVLDDAIKCGSTPQQWMQNIRANRAIEVDTTALNTLSSLSELFLKETSHKYPKTIYAYDPRNQFSKVLSSLNYRSIKPLLTAAGRDLPKEVLQILITTKLGTELTNQELIKQDDDNDEFSQIHELQSSPFPYGMIGKDE